MEHRTLSDRYYWDSQTRALLGREKFVVFQYTLAGRGRFELPGRSWSVEPGDAFTAIVPSSSRYFLPPESDSWTFFFLLITHPFTVERLTALADRHGPVSSWRAESPAVRRAADLCVACEKRHFSDEFAEEQSLLDWTVECERQARLVSKPGAERDQLLDRLRRLTLESLPMAAGVDQAAELFGMSRTHFTHYFKRQTGLSPGRFMMQLRLQTAADLLRRTSAPIKSIAAATGYGGPDLFCKAFKRNFGLTPGRFRKGM